MVEGTGGGRGEEGREEERRGGKGRGGKERGGKGRKEEGRGGKRKEGEGRGGKRRRGEVAGLSATSHNTFSFTRRMPLHYHAVLTTKYTPTLGLEMCI